MKTFMGAVGISLLVLFVVTGGGCTTARGEKIGTITKLAQQGPICPTWEGQIIRGGIASGTGAFGAPFDFTVNKDREDLVAALRTYMESAQEIKLYYTSYFPTFCSSDSGHFVYRIEPMARPGSR